jgi:hypothetical protein
MLPQAPIVQTTASLTERLGVFKRQVEHGSPQVDEQNVFMAFGVRERWPFALRVK